MLRIALVLAVLAGHAYAEGQPVKQAPRCQIAPIKGTPIFEARYVAAKGRSVTTKLYATGTFTRASTRKPKTPPATQTSCIEKAKADKLTKVIKSAQWKVTHHGEACAAKPLDWTEIYVAGKKQLTVQSCNHLALDEESNAALETVASELGAFGIDVLDEVVTE